MLNSDNMGGPLCRGKVMGPEAQIFGSKAKAPYSEVFFLYLLSSSCKKREKAQLNKTG